jgi:hypothetical protein
MIAEAKGARLLRGFRRRSAADIEALEDALVRVSHLAITFKDTWRSWTSIR